MSYIAAQLGASSNAISLSNSPLAASAVENAGILAKGIDLMVFGMGSVFIFLTLLVLGVLLMSKFLQTFFPEPQINTDKTGSAFLKSPQALDHQTTKILQAAVDAHRKSQA